MDTAKSLKDTYLGRKAVDGPGYADFGQDGPCHGVLRGHP